MYPRNNLSYTGNFLQMMFATPCEDYEVDPLAERAMDLLFICMPITNRMPRPRRCACRQLRRQPVACIAAGTASLWGPAHGGANEAVLDMLEQIGDVRTSTSIWTRPRTRTIRSA